MLDDITALLGDALRILSDIVALFGPELTSMNTLIGGTIVLAVLFLLERRRRRNAASLRAKLDQITARIAALEAAEDRRFLVRIKSGSLVPSQGSDSTNASTAAAEAPNVHRLPI